MTGMFSGKRNGEGSCGSGMSLLILSNSEDL